MRMKLGLSSQILLALISGVGCGLFFGDYCSRLSIVGDAFVGLLRMTVLPYIVVSLIASLGRLSLQHSRRLAAIGGTVLLGLWLTALLTVCALSGAFPEWKAGSFFSTAMTEPPAAVDLLSIFIPSNIFAALSENQVPAVVLLCICIGTALGGMEKRELLITQLDILAKALIRVSSFVTRLSPMGVFAIAASTAGTISLDELGKLQAYIIAYAAGALFLGLIVLPGLVATCTPLRYRDVLSVSRDAMIMALATGKLIVVLPLLIEKTEQLVARLRLDHDDDRDVAPAVDVLYPVAYSFPHVGKLLGILFIPFAAWFLGNRLDASEYPSLLVSGVFAYFGGPVLATPFLLDQMHLPHDMFQLFLLSGVVGERFGDALGAMHLTAFTLLTTSAFLGRLTFRPLAAFKFLSLVTVTAVVMLIGIRATLSQTLRFVADKQQFIAHMQLLEEPVGSVVYREASPNPVPRLPGESTLDRIRRRGIIRVGYNEDKLPFAYFNRHDDLVGLDVNMAHALARDLRVRIEFVRFDRQALAAQLAEDDFDVVMSGLVGTLERSESMQHTAPYMDVTLALVVPDFRVRTFQSVEAMQQAGRLRIGFVELSRGFVERLRDLLPQAELVELRSNGEFFESDAHELSALLISAESGSAFTLLYPEFEVVIPSGPRVSIPLFYAIGERDTKFRDFLEHWLDLRRKDGTMQEYYEHWILGQTRRQAKPRWCVIRDVLHWVE